METVGTGAGQLTLKLQIGSARALVFVFKRYDSTTELTTDEDISTKTFSFTLWKFKGARKHILNYTNGNGITVPIYSTNEIRVDILAADVSGIDEGEGYWELRRTDLDEAKISGPVLLSFDAPQ